MIGNVLVLVGAISLSEKNYDKPHLPNPCILDLFVRGDKKARLDAVSAKDLDLLKEYRDECAA